MLHVSQLILHTTTVTTMASTTPVDDRSIAKKWPQEHAQLLGSAAHFSAGAAQHDCHHHGQDYPMSRPIRRQQGQQKLARSIANDGSKSARGGLNLN